MMLDYRGRIVLGMLCAIFAGGGLAIGLLGSSPIVDGLFGRQRSLPEIAADINARGGLVGGVRIPQGLIEALPQTPWNGVALLVSLLGLVAIIGGGFQFLHAFLSLTVVHRTVMRVRRRAFRSLLFMPLLAAQHGDGERESDGVRGSADAVSRLIADADQLAYGLEALLSKAVTQVTKGLGALVFALVINWRLTVLALLIGPVVYGVIRFFARRIKRAARAAMGHRSEMMAIATEAAHALRVVKAYTAERSEAARFGRANRRVYGQMLRARTARALSKPLVEVLSVFILAALALIAFKAIDDGELRPEDFAKVLGGLLVAGAALKPLTGIVNDVQSSAGAAERLLGLMRAAPEPGHERGLARLPRHCRDIELRDVVVRYPGASEDALAGVSLRVGHGERVAVVGPNGSGKTTLVGLLYRLYDPQRGAVLVDGHDLREVSVRSLRRQVGLVAQEPVLFEGTVRENVAYGTPGADEARVLAALRGARALDFVRRLEGGLDAPIAERGVSLSGGQRQRLAIARAILRDPAILILDEATSMVDSASEAEIACALADFARGRTTFVVAHRLSTVRGADRIVVLGAGRIVDQGGHEALLGRCALYAELVRTQLGAEGDSGAG